MTVDALLDAIRFDADGLVPAVAQDAGSGDVLMVAWMNRDAVRETVRTGRACYWSRSRQAPWRKGDVSGQVQHLRELRLDCDGDTILLVVDQTGVACHTGRRSCFYRAWRNDGWQEVVAVAVSPDELYGDGRAGDGARTGSAALPSVDKGA